MCVDVSGCRTLLMNGADVNGLGMRDAAAIHLAVGAESHSELYTSMLLNHMANPNLPYVHFHQGISHRKGKGKESGVV